MAVKRIVVTVCDICSEETDVSKVEVAIGTARRKVDLCVKCIAPIEKVFSKGERPRTRKRAAARAGGGPRTMTMEEIEKVKAGQQAS